MSLPNFLICGTQKGGSTALYYYLKEHPQIYLHSKKEIHYFDLNYHRGIEWYKRYFKNTPPDCKAIGEASPSYMYLEEVAERIFWLIPDIKLIFILRDPVRRAYSHYWHEVNLGYEWMSFENALEKEEERLKRGDIFNRQHYSYKDRGKYIDQLERFRKYFSKDQMLVVINDELKKKPESTLKKILKFLDVDENFSSRSWHIQIYPGRSPRIWKIQRLKRYIPIRSAHVLIDLVNLKSGYPTMDFQTRETLIKYFKPYNKKLQSFLNRQLKGWLL